MAQERSSYEPGSPRDGSQPVGIPTAIAREVKRILTDRKLAHQRAEKAKFGQPVKA